MATADQKLVKKVKRDAFRRLPFYCCSYCLKPAHIPVCTEEGFVFDEETILEYLKRHSTNPVTGNPLSKNDLFPIKFHKNTDDQYHCPLTFRVFTDHTHIVAIRPSGNVYAFEGIKKLNIEPDQWQDLLTNEPFTKKDIITIQDPHNLDKQNFSQFHHIKNELAIVNPAEEQAKKKSSYYINSSSLANRILNELSSKEIPKEELDMLKVEEKFEPGAGVEGGKAKVSGNAAHYSTGRMAASFTSTSMVPVTINERALFDENEVMYRHIKTKGYVRIKTNLGDLDLELHCDQAPLTCHNFLLLCKSGYYNGVAFHRSIKNFMIQGGDPTGTGKGGESYWKKDFKDEFKPNLTHDKRGVLSMANRGPNTNSSQFFITFNACHHLDKKHSVFGSVIQGLDTLVKMEAIPTTEKDKPKQDIRIIEASIFQDPFEEYQTHSLKKEKRQLKQEEKRKKDSDASTERWFQPAMASEKSTSSNLSTSRISEEETHKKGVGKYLSAGLDKKRSEVPESLSNLPFENALPPPKKKKVVAKSGFGDFSSW